MKKYLLPSALILLLGLGLALGQTINKSIQLSQDPTGPVGIDTNFGVYFPGHILSAPLLGGRPQPTVAGFATTSITGSDTAGTVTMGTSAATAIVTFGQVYISVPACVLTSQKQLVTTPISYTLATTGINITQPTNSGNLINFWCSSVS